MERVTMFIAQSTGLIWVVSVEQHIFWTKKHCERLCGDLLVVHLRKCMFGNREISSH
jgi:hypothetical protein